MFTQGYTAGETALERETGYAGSRGKAGRAGTSHENWIFQAIEELRREEGVERVGVWLDEQNGPEGGLKTYRGEVWEEGASGGVLEWNRVTSDALLPWKALRAGMSSEYEIHEQGAGAILAPELQLRRVVWTPVTVRGDLRGLVMLGSWEKRRLLPVARAERVAEELGLLLELEEEQKVARGRKADLEFSQRIRGLLRETNGPNNMLFGQLAESCTRGEATGGVGTVFAVVGERKEGRDPSGSRSGEGNGYLLVRGSSGDETWTYAVNGGPLESLWRRAVESRRAAVAEAEQAPLTKEISRVVAVPVELGSKVVGVLLAGLPERRARMESLERLKWRSSLAAEIFAEEQRSEERARNRRWERALLETSEQVAVLVDGEGRIAGMSESARKILGSEEEVARVGKHFTELFAPRHRERVTKWAEGSGAGDTRHDASVEVEWRGGKRYAVTRLSGSDSGCWALRMEAVQEADGKEAARESHEVLQQALEWLEEGVAVFAENGALLAHNAMFLRCLGLSEGEGRTLMSLEEVIQASARNASDPEMFARNWRARAASCTDGTQEELQMTEPVGQTIERYMRPMVTVEGKRFGRVEVYRGASGWRTLQSKMAQTENLASLGLRLMSVVHELNNPLATILGNAQRLMQKESANGHAGEAAQILQEAERATGMVRQLLDRSREDRAERQVVSLNELVRATVEMQRAAPAEPRVELKLELEETLPQVHGNYAQIQQMLLNLLQNSQQAMEGSGVGGYVVVRTGRDRSGLVMLEVEDNGPGIPEAIRSRVFDPFFTTKPTGRGTGLGLAIVWGFARQQGGSVRLESPSAGGTRFVVELPVEEGVTDAREVAARCEGREVCGVEHGVDGKRELAGARVLVVEDEPTVAALIADVLREEGMQVDLLEDGARALEAARGVAYDLVICDLHMPGMDGQEFFGALERAGSPLRERILFVTGDGMAVRSREFLEQHGLPHVDKPFHMEELCLAVRQLLWGEGRRVAGWCEEVAVRSRLGTGEGDEGDRVSEG